MRFFVHTPAPPLDRYIERFYAPVGPAPYGSEYVMPGPLLDLKINFGGRVRAKRAGVGEWDALPLNGWCMGLWGEHHAVRWPEHLDYVGVSFRPGGVFALFGVEAHELGEAIVPIDALLGRTAVELRERLGEAPDVAARFRLLESLVRARVRCSPDVERLAPALTLLEQGKGMAPIADLAAAIEVSHKHLVTLFNRVVGAPPKTLARMYRLQHLLAAIEAEEPHLWTEVAHDFHYCDQAHFNRDFKRATGHTPAQYLEKRRQARAADPGGANHPRLLPAG